ncbi:MAG: EamA family transporter [Aggregatilineales bacterium]
MQTARTLIRGGVRLYASAKTVPPTSLVLLSMISVQVGAAFAKDLFAALGPAGTVFLRTALAALVLTLLWRPRAGGHTRQQYLAVALFGCGIAFMNLSFYFALARIPLGVAVTLEFVGPLGLAVAGSRRLVDLIWVTAAALGVLLLSPIGGNNLALDPIGILLALGAGVLWAAYIISSERVGRFFPGGNGLALALCVGSIVLLPFGVLSAGPALLNLGSLAIGFGVAMLSSAIPFSLELEALRRLPSAAFGILMSLEPAIAAVVGVLLLGETLNVREIIAIALVVIAAGGASREPKRTLQIADVTHD